MLEEDLDEMERTPPRYAPRHSQHYFRWFSTRSGKTFDNYEDFQEARLKELPYWKRPFVQFKYDWERVVERYFEDKHDLPLSYLRGLFCKKPPGMSVSQFARIVASEFQNRELEFTLREVVSQEVESKLCQLRDASEVQLQELERKVNSFTNMRSQKLLHNLTRAYDDLDTKLGLIADLLISLPDPQDIPDLPARQPPLPDQGLEAEQSIGL